MLKQESIFEFVEVGSDGKEEERKSSKINNVQCIIRLKFCLERGYVIGSNSNLDAYHTLF